MPKLINDTRIDQILRKIKLKIDAVRVPNPLPINMGGTGGKDVANAINNLGAAAKSHKHPITDITGTIPVASGGTGATNAAGALNNIGAAPKSHKHPITDITGLNIPAAATSGDIPLANQTMGTVGTSIKFARADHVHPNNNYKSSTITLPKSGWKNNQITVKTSYVTSDNTIIVSAFPTDGRKFYTYDIYCSSQANGALTFKCAKHPLTDVKVNIIILR